VNHANNDEWRTIQVIFNGNRNEIEFSLAGHIRWRIVARNTMIDPGSQEYALTDKIKVPGISMLMLVED
jgi:hypothetical protein